MLVAILFSAMCGFNDPSQVDPMLLAPCIRKFINFKSKEVKEKLGDNNLTIHTFEVNDNQLYSQ